MSALFLFGNGCSCSGIDNVLYYNTGHVLETLNGLSVLRYLFRMLVVCEASHCLPKLMKTEGNRRETLLLLLLIIKSVLSKADKRQIN